MASRMMTLVINGAPPWDGRYEFEDFAFTNMELYEIRQLSGLRAAELIDALDANDTAAYVGVAMVILKRHGHRLLAEDLWDAKVGSIQIELTAAADPTTSAVEGAPNVETNGGGDGGNPGGEPSPDGPTGTGSRSSETPSTSPPVTSAT